MYILGVNSVYHESSATLLKDGIIIGAIEEERLNRVKHAKASSIENPHHLPLLCIEYLLNKEKISLSDIEYIGYSINPVKRLLNIDLEESVEAKNWGTRYGEELLFANTLKVKEQLESRGFKGHFLWLDHHHCHAAASFFSSPYNDSAVLSIDGIGEIDSTVIYAGTNVALKQMQSFSYPNSLGFVWEKISQFLGFTEYDACKVMGLCAYGKPDTFVQKFSNLVRFDNGLFTVDNKILNFRNSNFACLEKFFSLKRRDKSEPLLQVHYDIAASMQAITNHVVCSMAQLALEMTGSKNLCLSGGVALNCVTNTHILENTDCENIYISPAPHDAGTSLGAALIVWHELLKNPRHVHSEHVYLGPSFADADIEMCLKKHNMNYVFCDNIEKKTAGLIANGAIVGWFQGGMEFGPRALGNRSLLGDPRNHNLREIMNLKVKHREIFRPFAPSVLLEEAHKWFHIAKRSISSDYMLFSFTAKDECKGLIPAVIHVDDTSRIQTVSKQSNAKYYSLIKEFFALTGVPMLLNTSFNDDEPIVCSPDDAIATFMKTNIDHLVMGNFLIQRS